MSPGEGSPLVAIFRSEYLMAASFEDFREPLTQTGIVFDDQDI